MKQVFAVFFLFIFLCSCNNYSRIENKENTSESIDNKKSIPINITNQNIIYSTSANLNKDIAKEYIYLMRNNNKLLLKLTDSSNSYYKELNISLHNYSCDIIDVNNDEQRDLILYDTDDKRQNLYVFSFDNNNIQNILNSTSINDKVEFKKINKGYLIKAGNLKKYIKHTGILKANINYSDIGYSPNGTVFESIGEVLDQNNKCIYVLSLRFSLDKNNNIDFNHLELIPKSHIKPSKK